MVCAREGDGSLARFMELCVCDRKRWISGYMQSQNCVFVTAGGETLARLMNCAFMTEKWMDLWLDSWNSVFVTERGGSLARFMEMCVCDSRRWNSG